MTVIEKRYDEAHSMVPGLSSACSLKVENIIDRSETDIPSEWGPFASVCALMVPMPLVISFPGLFERGWRENAGLSNAYYRYIGDAWLGISLEGRFWMIEKTVPGRSAAVLAFGSGLVITRNPMAAAQLAELCSPKPPEHSSLLWGPYW